MSEREGAPWPSEGKAVAVQVSERVRSIIAEAEAAAEALRHGAEQDAQARRRSAETEALKIIEDARREAERYLTERIQRISSLSDEILERGQTIVERLDAAEQVRAELGGLVVSLGEAANRLTNEVRAMPGPRGPDIAPGTPEPARAAEPYSAEPAAAEPAAAAAEPATAEPEPVAPEPVAAEPQPEPEPVAAEPQPAAAEPERQPAAAEPEPEPDAVTETAPVPGAEVESDALDESPAEPRAPVEPESDAELEPAGSTAAAPDVDSVPDEPEVHAPPTDEEAALLERVRAAERERSEAEAGEDGEDGERTGEAARAANAGPALEANGSAATDAGPDLVGVPTGEEEPRDAGGEPSGGAAASDQALGARLVALQMAVAGGNRGEVESHLRRAFELDEPGEILDDIFGSGTDPDKRVVWPEAG